MWTKKNKMVWRSLTTLLLMVLPAISHASSGDDTTLGLGFGADAEHSGAPTADESACPIYWQNLCCVDCILSASTYMSGYIFPDDTYYFEYVTEPTGIVGLSLNYAGPFTDTLTVPVTVKDGYGRTNWYVKILEPGTVLIPAPCANEPYTWVCVKVDPQGRRCDAWGLAIGSVESVAFVSVDAPLTLNPSSLPGGGLRIFPGKTSPTDTTRHNKVKVTAQTSTPGMEVFFKAFDLDDPSSDSAPVDITGDPQGNDNNGSPKAGTLSVFSEISDAAGVAEVEFEVTMQPGDNFRVCAACDSSYLAGIQVLGTGLVDAGGNSLPNDRAKVTEMLTVWRYLHIEMDSMGLVAGNDLRGTITEVQTHTKFSVLHLDPPPGAANRKRFENGRIWMGVQNPPVSFAVRSNGNKSVSVLGAVSQTAVGQPFFLVDDDDFNANNWPNLLGDIGEDIPEPDTRFMRFSDSYQNNRFVVAYVKPAYDLGWDTNVPFVLNTVTDKTLLETYKFDNVASHTDPDFWTVYLLGAYQCATNQDGDPDKGEKLIFGRADLNSEGGCVFHEALKEDGRDSAATAAHEIGHLFGAIHKDGGLMGIPSDAYPHFSDKTIARIRSISHP